MKIVLDASGNLISRHVDAANVSAKQYSDYGPVLIGIVPDDLIVLADTPSGADRVSGSIIDVARDLARQMVRNHVEGIVRDAVADYPQAERDTWSAKLAEAQAVQADEKAETVYLAAVAKATGKDVKDVAKTVVKKAAAFAADVAHGEAERAHYHDKIDKAKNVKSVIAAVDGIG